MLEIDAKTLHNEDKFIKALEAFEKEQGKLIEEMVLKKMVLTVIKWKE